MKKFILLIALFVNSVTAFAGVRLASCASDETTVDIFGNANGSMVAVLTTDGPGSSYPTFKIRVTEVTKESPNYQVFLGPHFSLILRSDGQRISGNLNASEIGFKSFEVYCKKIKGN